MFGWGKVKQKVLESVRFCLGGHLLYTFLIPTHPYHLASDMGELNSSHFTWVKYYLPGILNMIKK